MSRTHRVRSFGTIVLMIRTRDFLLFILTLVFLGVAIANTVTKDIQGTYSGEEVVFNDTELDLEARSESSDIDRQSIIDRLRSKLLSSKERIEVSPSVESVAVTASPSTTTSNASMHVQKCAYPDDFITKVPSWPFSKVQVKIENGKRIFYTTVTQETPVSASSTASSTVIKKVTTTESLLELPLLPTKQQQGQCVPSEVIGVTPNGLLIFNSSVATYAGVGVDTLIGYARDGFPIYGVYAGEVDQCGGYDHPSGYRYTVSTERAYIVGCYVSTPQTFNL